MNTLLPFILLQTLNMAAPGEKAPIPLPWTSTITPRTCLDSVEIAGGTFYADGPIHFPPVVHEGQHYFTSDDGYLYCVEGSSGKVRWKVLGGPSDMKMVDADAGRMISAWPARGGAVLHDGKVYFGAGLFAVQGVFLCCVDASSGKLLWRRDLSPGGEVGPIPLGSLRVVEQPTKAEGKQWILKVPQGEGAQGAIDFTLDGKFFQHDQLDYNGKRGNWQGFANIIWHGADSGLRVGVDPWYWSVRHHNPDAVKPIFVRPQPIKKKVATNDPVPEVIVQPDLAEAPRKRMKESLDQSTRESKAASELAESILKDSNARQGYALVLGLSDGRLAEQLALRSDLQVMAVDDNKDLIASLRQRWTAQGIYSTRISACVADPMTYRAAKGSTDLVVMDIPRVTKSKSLREIPTSLLDALHPYRGIAFFLGSGFEAKTPPAKTYEMHKDERLTILRRRGGVEGGADVGHITGTAGGTNASADVAVKAPLSALWFGSRPAIVRLLGEGATPMVIAEGRAFAQGGAGLREKNRQEPLWMLKDHHAAAFDVYTGRQLWERHDTNGPLAAIEDVLYHGTDKNCEVLDAATGKRLHMIEGHGNQPHVSGTFLVLTSDKTRRITCLNRQTRAVLWKLERPETPVDHVGQTFVVGGGKLMVLNLEETGKPKVRVLDLATGKKRIDIDLAKNVEVSCDHWLRLGKRPWTPYELQYQENADVLVVRCNKPASKTGVETKLGNGTYQVAGYQGRDGKLLWTWVNKDMSMHVTRSAIIGRGVGKHGHVGYVYDLQSGKQTATWDGYRGCGLEMSVNEWLALSRSELASYYDIRRLTGYHPLGPFRLSCGSRSAIGNGVLFKPDEHWGCACMTVLHMAVGYIHNPEIGPVTHAPSIGMEQFRKKGFDVGDTTSWAGSRYVQKR